MTTKMISTCRRYFEALSALDREAYLACFSVDAELHDPYGGRPFGGHQGLAKWVAGMEQTWTSFGIQPGEYYIGGDRAAVTWTAQAQAKSGKQADFGGINVFTIGEDGLITRLDGYWDAAAMLAQIR